ncbi:hypothetical protein ACR8AL_12760 [Clavibacter sepedonicus]|nr:hypothetical protein [Clavibacter sepedonicus]UUK66336.1 hypothetical protein LRE50_03690 [Clavibacter sepedonicus]
MRETTPAGRPRLSREDASSRITAFVYGNIVTLATIAPMTTDAAESGRGLWYVLATASSTFLAHTFAESVGRRARSDHRLTAETIRAELRDSLPVLTSALVPAAVLAYAALTDVPGLTAEIIAIAYLVIRLALLGPVVARLRGERPSLRTFAAGVVLAAVGIGIALVKAGPGF